MELGALQLDTLQVYQCNVAGLLPLAVHRKHLVVILEVVLSDFDNCLALQQANEGIAQCEHQIAFKV